jgi:hypothetical protein
MRPVALLLLFCSLSAASRGQNDLVVTLHERTLNNLFGALGEFTGKEEYELLLIKRSFTWTLTGMRIELEKDSAVFITQARVETDFGTYTDEVRGKVAIGYSESSMRPSMSPSTPSADVGSSSGSKSPITSLLPSPSKAP